MTPPLDRAIAEVAGRQHGVVALGQLRALGLTGSGVRDRVAVGRLHRVHRGAYAVGHPLLSLKGRYMAAVLACGDGAVLSHRDGADLLGLYSNGRARIDVTVPRRSAHQRPGIHVHCSRQLHPDDVTTVDAIPCTTVARTLIDLADFVTKRRLERAVDRAEQLRVYDDRAVKAAIERSATRRGTPNLRTVIDAFPGADQRTKNDLEEAFLDLCAEANLPTPRVNVWIPLKGGDVEADFLWEAERLIVEVDGWETHGTRRAFESDRERDRRLKLAEWEVVHFTWRDVFDDPARVAREVGALLAQAAASRSAITSRTP